MATGLKRSKRGACLTLWPRGGGGGAYSREGAPAVAVAGVAAVAVAGAYESVGAYSRKYGICKRAGDT